ncbi:MAG: hypothetical protein Q4G67_12810 [Actinomycetia bacterium]|nr:hypothetical protein [Actinomycetes bacterium]
MDNGDWTGDDWPGRAGPDRGAGYGDQRQGGSGGTIAIAVVAVLAVLALLGVAAYFFVFSDSNDSRAAAPSLDSTALDSEAESEPEPGSPAEEDRTPQTLEAPQHPDADGAPFYSPEQRTSTSTERSAPTSSRQRSNAGESRGGGYPSGADRSGWNSPSGARCNAGDPAHLMGRTDTARFVICENPDNGRFYYKGVTGSGSIELDDPTLSGGGATVRNVNVVYRITPERMTIDENGSEIWNQRVHEYWTR